MGAGSAESAESGKGKGKAGTTAPWWPESAESGKGKGKAQTTPPGWPLPGQQVATLAMKGIELPTKGTGKGDSLPATLDSVTPTLIRTGRSAESAASRAASDAAESGATGRHNSRVRDAPRERLDEIVERLQVLEQRSAVLEERSAEILRLLTALTPARWT